MEQTVEQKLKALWAWQSIETKIDKIRQIRGELPIEVADLEDEIAGLEYPESKRFITSLMSWRTPSLHVVT